MKEAMSDYLIDGPADSPVTLILAHGAGADMEHSFMAAAAAAIAGRNIRVVRFNFPYMIRRKLEGKKFPPNRAPVLLEAYEAVIADIDIKGKLLIAGKSMGGRMASVLADEKADELNISGLICLGFPFFAPGKERIEENNRGIHLASISTPTLIIQGERDTFGTASDLEELPFSKNVKTHILPDGDHSFVPRKKSGFTLENNISEMADAIEGFVSEISNG